MRQRQWVLSIILFSVSISFLLFSKNFFRQEPVQQSALALPAVSVPQCNVVLLANKDYYPVLKQHFQRAHKSIVGTVFLFKTTLYRGNEPSDLMKELIAARKRNVEVELVMDVSNDDRESREANLRVGTMLEKAGINVRFDTADVITHSKAFVIDDRYCFVGSHNLTHSAMSVNEELSLYVDSPDMAHKITDFIRQIPLSSDPLKELKRNGEEASAESVE
jgi:phosphatidylserine/phosphatidylglycerophosphate/cardiolipin synthase-like enzyme